MSFQSRWGVAPLAAQCLHVVRQDGGFHEPPTKPFIHLTIFAVKAMPGEGRQSCPHIIRSNAKSNIADPHQIYRYLRNWTATLINPMSIY
jgi:hypothetical protein